MKRPSNDDIGLELVNHTYDLMQIDAKWAMWARRGFKWWGWGLAQRVWAEPPVEDGGYLVTRLHARTDVFDGFDGSDRQLSLLGVVGKTLTMSGFVRSVENPGRLQLASSVFVHEGTLSWVKRVFSLAVAIQAAEAAIAADTLPEFLGMQPAVTAHPESGPRTEMDDMLRVIELMVRPKGAGPSLFAGKEMSDLLDLLKAPPCVLATGDERGVGAEFPYPGGTSILEFLPDVENPKVGSGLLALLTIPEGKDDAESTRKALEWNELELKSNTRAHLLGSWCASERGITHASFFPNVLYSPGCVQNLGMSHAMRARWLTQEVKGYAWEEHYTEAYQRKIAYLARLNAQRPSRKERLTRSLFGLFKRDE